MCYSRLIHEIAGHTEVIVSAKPGCFRIAGFQKAGHVDVSTSDGAISMRWDKADRFTCPRNMVEKLLEWAQWWHEVSRHRGDTTQWQTPEPCWAEIRASLENGPIAAILSEYEGASRHSDVDRLAQVIRTVDGNHSLGAGALAERIIDALPFH